MIWIDDQDVTTEGEQRPHIEWQTSNMFDKTTAVHAPTDPAALNEPGDSDPMQFGGYGDVKTYTQAVDQTVGGVAANGVQLGWSDGVLSIRQRWQKLTGLVLAPPKTAELNIGHPYGRVGLNNRAQNLLLGAQYQEVSDLLPSFTEIARSYTRPDGNANA